MKIERFFFWIIDLDIVDRFSLVSFVGLASAFPWGTYQLIFAVGGVQLFLGQIFNHIGLIFEVFKNASCQPSSNMYLFTLDLALNHARIVKIVKMSAFLLSLDLSQQNFCILVAKKCVVLKTGWAETLERVEAKLALIWLVVTITWFSEMTNHLWK